MTFPRYARPAGGKVGRYLSAPDQRQFRVLRHEMRDAGPVPGTTEERQLPSGSPFDPAPQFWVDRLDTEDRQSVIGRCWFGPIELSMTFDRIAIKRGETWDCHPCDLRIDALQILGQMIDQIAQTYSGRLTLTGSMPQNVSGAVLICGAEPTKGWVLRANDHTGVGQMWFRERS